MTNSPWTSRWAPKRWSPSGTGPEKLLLARSTSISLPDVAMELGIAPVKALLDRFSFWSPLSAANAPSGISPESPFWDRKRNLSAGSADTSGNAPSLERREQAQVRRGALQAVSLQLQHHHAAAGALPHPDPPRRVVAAGVAGRARVRHPLVQLLRRAAVRPTQRVAERLQHVGLRRLSRRRREDERHRGQEEEHPGGLAGHGLGRWGCPRERVRAAH
uniref:Uncharacterized protein n=1 Tax=Setaria italica TaxID=4555 RepID=K3XZ99_SETIT